MFSIRAMLTNLWYIHIWGKIGEHQIESKVSLDVKSIALVNIMCSMYRFKLIYNYCLQHMGMCRLQVVIPVRPCFICCILHDVSCGKNN